MSVSRCLPLITAAVLGLSGAVFARADTPPLIEPGKPRPHLFYTASEIAAFRARIRTDPERLWYEREIRANAERGLNEGIHSGSEPERLRVYFERADEMALALLVDPDAGFRRRLLDFATRLLTGAAAGYDAMQLPTFWGLASSPSTFALAALYDSIHPELSDSLRSVIAGGLLARILSDIPREPHFNEWANKGVISHMALGVMALALEDQAVFERAYGTDPDDEPSFTWGIRHGYGEDALWTEPSQMYHQYTTDNVLPFVLATLRSTTAGVPGILATTPSLLEIYRSEVELAFPNLLMVPTGDSRWPRRVRLDHAEVLNSIYPGNEVSRHVMNLAYGPLGITRGRLNFSWRLVHYGDTAPGPGPFQPASRVYNDAGSGFGVLRYGAGAEQLYAFLDFAASSPNHDHYDKLSIYLAGAGKVPTTSTVRYERGGFGHTIFQNTVVLDRTSQGVQAGELECFARTPGHALQILQASAAATYGDIPAYERILLAFRDEYVIDVFTVIADGRDDGGRHDYDWVQHRLDEPLMVGVAAFAPDVAGDADGYGHLTAVESARATEPLLITDSQSVENGGIRTILVLEAADQVFRARAPGPRRENGDHPLYFVRRAGTAGVRFVAVHALRACPSPPRLVSVRSLRGAQDATGALCGLEIGTISGRDHVLIHREGSGGGEVRVGAYSMYGKAALIRHDTATGRDGASERAAAPVQSTFLLLGTWLSVGATELIDTSGAIASIESGGDTVTIVGRVREFRIYAPSATNVLLNGQPVPFARSGDHVVSTTFVDR